MNRNPVRRSLTLRSAALAAAITSALAMGPAAAQSVAYGVTFPGGAQTITFDWFLKTLENDQWLGADVTAQLPAGDRIFITEWEEGAPQVNSDNRLFAGTFKDGAAAGANFALNSIELETIGSDGSNEGAGLLSGQVVVDSAVTALIDQGWVRTELTGKTSGDITHSGNSIVAGATLNSATNQVAGEVPEGFEGATASGIAYTHGTAASSLQAQGSVVVANVQASAGADAGSGSSARVVGSDVSVADTPTTTMAGLDMAVTVDGNAIAAQYAGNRADNRFDVTGGTRFDGSAAVVNAQSNTASTAASDAAAASVETSGVGAFLNGALEGSLSVSDNRLAAVADGNAASNVVRTADGVDVHAVGANWGALQQLGTGSNIVDGNLGLANSQHNEDGEVMAAVGPGSTILGTVLHLGPGSALSMTGDAIEAQARGNAAGNLIQADAASNFSANSSASNQQVNDETEIKADVAGGMIVAGVLGDVTNSLGGLDDESEGDISVTDGRIAAMAQANQAETAVDVGGANLSTWNGVDSVFAFGGTTHLVSTGSVGLGAGNQQVSSGTVSASVSTGDDAFGTHGGWIGAYFNGGLDSGAATVAQSTVAADAGGNLASTAIVASGTNGSINAQLPTNQEFSGTAEAEVAAADVGVYIGGGSSTSGSIAVSDNTIQASSSANRARSSIDADFDTMIVGRGANTWTDPTVTIDHALDRASVRAGFGIAANQYASGSISADVSQGLIGADIGDHPRDDASDSDRGNVIGGGVSVTGNALAANAVGNDAANRIAIDGGAVTTGASIPAASPHPTEQVAAIGSLQTVSGNVGASISADDADVREILQVGVLAHRNLEGTAVTVSDNGINAFAAHNMADNALTFVGNQYTPDQVASVGIGGTGMIDARASVYAGFSLQNHQDALGDATAEARNGNVGISMTEGEPAEVTGSSLTVNGNSIGADSRGNYAGNRIGLGVTYDASGNAIRDPMSGLATSAIVYSEQEAAGSFESTSNALLGVVAGHYDVSGSTVVVTDNAVSGAAVANTATNRVAAAAATLGGDRSLRPESEAGYASATSYGVDTDFGVVNRQQHSGIAGASLDASASDGTGIGVGIGEGNLDGGSVTIAGNAQTALAQGNSASNSVSLAGSNVSAMTGMVNIQDMIGEARASAGNASVTNGLAFAVQVNGAVGTDAALPVTVADNTLQVQSGFNEAANQLRIDADGAITGGTAPGAELEVDAIAGVGAHAAHALTSVQSAEGDSHAETEAGLIGLEVVGMEASATPSSIGHDTERSSLAVSGNGVVAAAGMNRASNGVVLAGAAQLDASAGLANVQSATGLVDASVGSVDVGVFNRNAGEASGGRIANVDLTVSDNQLVADASANTAGNGLVATPSALNGAAAVAGTSVSVDASGTSLLANYGVLNQQRNDATVTADLRNSSIGLNADAGTVGARGSASQLLNGTNTVSGNRSMASASANTATNSVALAMATGMPSAALANVQANSAAVSSVVTGVSMGVAAGGLPGTGATTVTGNVIGATTSANSAINHIGVGN